MCLKIYHRDDQLAVKRYAKAQRAPWLKKIEEARHGARFLMQKPTPLRDALTKDSVQKSDIPLWLGRAVGPDSQSLNPIGDPLRGFGP